MDVLKHEHPARRSGFLGGGRIRNVGGAETLGQRLVALLFPREIEQELLRREVETALRRLRVEAAGLLLHQRRLLAHRLDAERTDEPVRLARREALDVLAPERRDDVAEFRTVARDQPVSVAGFLLCHVLEHRGRRREIRLQSVGVGGVDPPVLFLGGNGKGEDFAFRQVRQVPAAGAKRSKSHHGRIPGVNILELF